MRSYARRPPLSSFPERHVAYIDVRANPEPNMLARKAADETARTFKCTDKPQFVGARGRAAELATPDDK